MHRKSLSTLKVGLALFLAVFSNAFLPSAAAFALDSSTTETPPAAVTELTTPEEETTPPTEPESPPIPAETPSTPVVEVPEPAIEAMTPPAAESPVSGMQPVERSIAPLDTQSVIIIKEVTPAPPTVLTDECKDSYSIPTSEGVDYYRGETLLVQGSTQWTDGSEKTVEITAKAQPGYKFPGNKTEKDFTLRFETKCEICHRTASAGNPYVMIDVDIDSIDGDTGNDKGQGDHYAEHVGPVFPSTGIDGKWGDIIPAVAGHSGRNWEAGQAIYNNNCNVPVELTVTPGPCAYFDTRSSLTIDVTGTAKDSRLVLYNSLGEVVKYWDIEVDKDGNVTSPTFPLVVGNLQAGDYTVKVLTKGGEKVLATKNATIALCNYEVTPVAPTAYDLCYTDLDYIYIPETTGVTYMLNGEVADGYYHYAGSDLVVTAVAKAGYAIKAGATTSWTFDENSFTDEHCLSITKTAKSVADTNLNGKIDVGDTVTWEIIVTNNSEFALEKFHVQVEDLNATLEGEGYIEYLEGGDSVTLSATSTLTAEHLAACKITNTATFSSIRAFELERSLTSQENRFDYDYDWENPLATGSASAEYKIDCPTTTPGQVLSSTTTKTTTTQVLAAATTPAILPATGAASFLSQWLPMIAAALTYFVTRSARSLKKA